MLTQRDKAIISHLERFKICNTLTLAKLFFPSLRMAQIRLKWLADNREIKRDRIYIDNQYVYFLKKPKQIRHKLLISKFYVALKEVVLIKHFVLEKKIESIVPDMIIGYEYNKNKYIACIEVEISNNSISKKLDAYRKLYKTQQYKKYFHTMPILIIITDKKVPKIDDFKIIQIREDLSKIKDIMSRD